MSLTGHAWDAVPEPVKENDALLLVVLLTVVALLYAAMAAVQAFLAESTVTNAAFQAAQSILYLSAVYGILALALNLHWGYTGLFNIGVVGFMAVGVYTTSILAGDPAGTPPGLGLPVLVAVGGGVVAAAVVGGLAALPALQLDADYFAIVTVGFSEIIRLTLQADTFAGTVTNPESGGYNVVDVFGVTFGTGGGRGISTPFNTPMRFLFEGPLSPVGQTLVSLGAQFDVTAPVIQSATYTLAVLALVLPAYYVLVRRVGNSPFGRVLKAIREDELVAQSLGKDTRLFKIKVFMLGTGLMGLAGILWQGTRGFVNPNTFLPLTTFYVFTALVVGGAGSDTGSVVGGAVFAAVLLEGPRRLGGLITATSQATIGRLPQPNSFWAALTSGDPAAYLGYVVANIPNLKFVFLGAVLVYIMQNRSEGLMGHRKEIASSIDVLHRPREPGDGGGSPAANGGESRE